MKNSKYFTSRELIDRWQILPFDLLQLVRVKFKLQETHQKELEYHWPGNFDPIEFGPADLESLDKLYFFKADVEAYEKLHPELSS